MPVALQILDEPELERVLELLKRRDWERDGSSRLHKSRASMLCPPAAELVTAALLRSREFCRIVQPHVFCHVQFSRYVEGEGYGEHLDSHSFGGLRADVSVSLGLQASGRGGRLVVEGETIEPAPGCAAVFASSSPHRVEPVEQGERIVALAWVQSSIRDVEKRRIVAELEQVRGELANAAISPHFDFVSINLFRMWRE